MMKNHKRGFTLIELLVVISIIGMMSSVLLVAIQSARDKGRVAASLIFATTMNRGWGAESLGFWNFDEGSGLSAQDFGPNNITLNAQGTSARSPVRPGSSGYSLNYLAYSSSPGNNTDYFVSDLLYPKRVNLVANGGYTASVWVYKDNSIGGRPFTILGPSTAQDGTVGTSEDLLGYINISNNIIYFGPRASALSQFSYVFPTKQWTHLAYSYEHSSSPKLRLYINGKLVVTKTITSLPSNYIANKIAVGVGYDSTGVSGNLHFYAYMDDLAIYTNVLTANKIENIYAEGLKNHTLARFVDIRPK